VSPINETKRLSEKRAEVKLNNKKIAINKNARTLTFELSNDLVLKEKNNFPVNKLEINIRETNLGVLKGSIEFVLMNSVTNETPRTSKLAVLEESLYWLLIWFVFIH
jgi:hypothetical protein